MKVEKTRKLYKKRRHNKEIKRSRQPWNSNSPSDNQESNDNDIEEKSSNSSELSLDTSPQASPSNEPKISSEVIQFLNNPQTLLEFKQFQEYLKIKDTIRTRSNSAINELPKNTKEKLPITPPTTPTITKSKPSAAEVDFLTSIDEEDDFSETIDDNTEMPVQRNNASF
jgi:hypothetical protein